MFLEFLSHQIKPTENEFFAVDVTFFDKRDVAWKRLGG
jgi:hypothetical protein